MSIDNLTTATKKQVGDHVRLDLYFDNDSTYHGHFCNEYHGKYKFNKDLSAHISDAVLSRKVCMGLKEIETEIFKTYALVNRYLIKGNALYLFTSDKKRLVFKMEG